MESDGDIRNVFIKKEESEKEKDDSDVSVTRKKDDDFEVYFVKHLKEQQKDDATQTDESYTLDEKQILKNIHERRSANSENCSTIHQRPIPVLLNT